MSNVVQPIKNSEEPQQTGMLNAVGSTEVKKQQTMIIFLQSHAIYVKRQSSNQKRH